MIDVSPVQSRNARSPMLVTLSGMVIDGCNMGGKPLSRYLNRYAAADEKSKSIAERLIALESEAAVSMRGDL